MGPRVKDICSLFFLRGRGSFLVKLVSLMRELHALVRIMSEANPKAPCESLTTLNPTPSTLNPQPYTSMNPMDDVAFRTCLTPKTSIVPRGSVEAHKMPRPATASGG